MTRRPVRPDVREQVVAATIALICETGYYRASSNAIARRAGVTWGAIQHHFRSREALMLAALVDSVDRMHAALTAAAHEEARVQAHGVTLDERVRTLVSTMVDFCARPEYVASLQIMWNLAADPATRAGTREELVAASTRIDAAYHLLAAETDPQMTDELAELVRKLAWGLGVNLATQHMTRDYGSVERKQQHADAVDGLADLVVGSMRSGGSAGVAP